MRGASRGSTENEDKVRAHAAEGKLCPPVTFCLYIHFWQPLNTGTYITYIHNNWKAVRWINKIFRFISVNDNQFENQRAGTYCVRNSFYTICLSQVDRIQPKYTIPT